MWRSKRIILYIFFAAQPRKPLENMLDLPNILLFLYYIDTYAFMMFTMNSEMVSKLSKPTRTSMWYSLSHVNFSCSKSNV